MKRRNYVVAIGLIALFIQSDACAMEGEGRFARAGRWAKGRTTQSGRWVGQKAAQAKEMTVDKLYDMAKNLKKDVKEFLKCRKAGTCTAEQNRKVRVAATAIGAAAVVVTAAAVLAGGAYVVYKLTAAEVQKLREDMREAWNDPVRRAQARQLASEAQQSDKPGEAIFMLKQRSSDFLRRRDYKNAAIYAMAANIAMGKTDIDVMLEGAAFLYG